MTTLWRTCSPFPWASYLVQTSQWPSTFASRSSPRTSATSLARCSSDFPRSTSSRLTTSPRAPCVTSKRARACEVTMARPRGARPPTRRAPTCTRLTASGRGNTPRPGVMALGSVGTHCSREYAIDRSVRVRWCVRFACCLCYVYFYCHRCVHGWMIDISLVGV